MAPRIDPAVIKTQIDSVMAEVAGIKAALEKLNGARAPTDFDSMAEAAASAVTAASPGGTSVAGGALLPLTDAQRRICVCVMVAFFEPSSLSILCSIGRPWQSQPGT